MLDLELLRSFVSVVDAGGFTRAGERLHRTQSTVSQQIKRLEDDVGRPLLSRIGKQVTPTDDGERLLSYARRILSLAEEARDVLTRPAQDGAVRLGIPEDFAAYRLTELLASFARSRPGLRLAWHMAYSSSSLAGVQAAIAAGLGLGILSDIAIQPEHRVLTAKDGFAPIDKTEVALVATPEASLATLRLADSLAEFCSSVQAEAA
ncbi:MAG: LysR family transcriptional regulator [Methylocella sp.]